MLDIGETREPKAVAHRGGGLLQLHPGARLRTPVELFPYERAFQADVRKLVLVNRLVVARQPLAALREAPALVQLGLVDQDVGPAQHIAKLRHIEPMPLQIRDDGGLRRREPLGCS